jgi:hypothetical protein
LEKTDWGPPTFDSSLVRRCHALRKKAVDEFTVEDLRIMIGQQISLEFLFPLAVNVIEANPLAEGDYYPGDLLASVLRVDKADWERWQDLHQRVVSVVTRLSDELTRAEGTTLATLRDSISEFTKAVAVHTRAGD